MINFFNILSYYRMNTFALYYGHDTPIVDIDLKSCDVIKTIINRCQSEPDNWVVKFNDLTTPIYPKTEFLSEKLKKHIDSTLYNHTTCNHSKYGIIELYGNANIEIIKLICSIIYHLYYSSCTTQRKKPKITLIACDIKKQLPKKYSIINPEHVNSG